MNNQSNNKDMEKEIKEILAFNELGFDVDKVEQYYNGELITDVELNMEDTNNIFEGVIMFHTEWGDAGTFDMLTTEQQEKIYDYLEKCA